MNMRDENMLPVSSHQHGHSLHFTDDQFVLLRHIDMAFAKNKARVFPNHLRVITVAVRLHHRNFLTSLLPDVVIPCFCLCAVESGRHISDPAESLRICQIKQLFYGG